MQQVLDLSTTHVALSRTDTTGDGNNTRGCRSIVRTSTTLHALLRVSQDVPVKKDVLQDGLLKCRRLHLTADDKQTI